MRDQAISNRRRPRRRKVRSASSAGVRGGRRVSLRQLARVIPPLVYLAVLILTAWLLYYSLAYPYFAVREVAVTGTRLLDAEQAREATHSLGRNVLLLRTQDVEQSVRSLSAVRDARVVLALPGRLEVEVTERAAVVQWQGRGGSFLVDREGVVFSSKAPLEPVTVIRELDGPAIEVGSRVDPGVLAAVKILEGALPQRAGIQPPWFDYSSSSGISVAVPGGPRIVFGDASALDSKLATLAAIREHLEATKARAEIIDLRFKDRPIYVLAPPALARSAQPR